jgi:hypothetical protein
MGKSRGHSSHTKPCLSFNVYQDIRALQHLIKYRGPLYLSHVRANRCGKAVPGHPSERVANLYPPIDPDGFDETAKHFPTRSRSDSRGPFSSQTSPAGFPGRSAPSDQHFQNSGLSPRLHSETNLARSKSHHRQTSIVHGIQHSRNGSFASSSGSPLSPRIIAAAGGGPDASYTGDPAFTPTMSMSSINSGTSFNSSTTLAPERTPSSNDASTNNLTQKRVERMHSGRSRREHGHHTSHSRHHQKEELKTVGEYALHVLFTSVSNIDRHL